MSEEKKTLEKIIGALAGLGAILFILKSIRRRTYAEVKPEHKEISVATSMSLIDTADISDQPILSVTDDIAVDSSVTIYLMGV
ncbi:MAG: hypothetical protein QXM79_07225 [Zestosphaera sp.]